MTAEEFVDRLEGQKNWSGGNWQCRCPVPEHEDRRNSLSVTEGEDKVLFYCHAGCYWRDVLDAMELLPKDLYHEQTIGFWGRPAVDGWNMKQPEAIYQYKDIDGTLAYEAVRFPNKEFRFRRPSNEGWIWNLEGVKRIPYRLPEILGALAIYITEGEKDADRLVKKGKYATCFPGGAGRNKVLARYVKFFFKAHVIIIADNDAPGLAYAEEILDALTGVATSVKIVRAKEGKDVSDHLDAGYTLEELVDV